MEIKISASMLRDYVSCKRKAYYRTLSLPREDTASLILGRAVHDMIDEYALRGKVDVDAYKQQMVTKLSSGPVTFYRWQSVPKLLRTLDMCFENYKSLDPLLPPLLDSEVGFDFIFEGIRIVGRFDQLREGNITELKTSRREPEDSFLKADIQTTVYLWAYEKQFNSTPTYYYFHLPSGKVYEVYRNDFTELVANIKEAARDAKAGYFPRQADGWKCSQCGYKEICLEERAQPNLSFQAMIERKTPTKKGTFFIA